MRAALEPLSKLVRLSRNPKSHNLGDIHLSYGRFGFLQRIIVNDATGRMIAGHGRVDALQQRKASGMEPPANVEARGGEWLVPADHVEVPEDLEEAAALALNRVGEGEWDDATLAQVLADLAAGPGLEGTGFDGEFLDELLALQFRDILAEAAQAEKESIKGKVPNPRQLPLDVIYTIDMADCTCCLAVQAGLSYGFRSAQYRLCPYCGQLSGRHKVMFIDNDFKDYQHARHLEVVAEHRPKYATVRDIMSERQCEEANIKFYSLDQILRWAEELEQYIENVIVIPKYDCIADIPEQYVLGYSVPTSYGGTPMPAEMFEGHRVHLLGGSWKAQLEYCALLGDDVVSLDTNYVQRQATLLGVAVRPDGSEFQCQDIGFDYLTNVRYAALALSFGAIGSKVNELYAGSSNPA